MSLGYLRQRKEGTNKKIHYTMGTNLFLLFSVHDIEKVYLISLIVLTCLGISHFSLSGHILIRKIEGKI